MKTRRNTMTGGFSMEKIIPAKIHLKRTNHINEKLTSAELGKLWATYMGNTMGQKVILFFLQHVEDPSIKKVLDDAYLLSEEFIQTIKEIFMQENYPIPIGFTEEDVNLDAPRLFLDEYYLHYLRYAGKAGVSIYSAAIPIMTRMDIREFFTHCLTSTMKLLSEVTNVLLEKGYLVKPPPIPTPEKVDFVKKQNYLNGFFGNIRPLHGLEIAHLYDVIENNTASKALLIGFSQGAKHEKVREFLIRGKELTHKHIELCSQQLIKDNLPAPMILDHLVTASTFPPFSDKLMVFHKIDMFSMKIRSYANALSLNGRRDLGLMYGKFLLDIGLYVEDGAQIMIDQGWMEQPPEAVDRDFLTSK
jgi:hypothetical protein